MPAPTITVFVNQSYGAGSPIPNARIILASRPKTTIAVTDRFGAARISSTVIRGEPFLIACADGYYCGAIENPLEDALHDFLFVELTGEGIADVGGPVPPRRVDPQ
jgi:hypothetical protein